MRVCVETYGCTMNQGEGLELEQGLLGLGHEMVDSCEEADVAVVNTCVVIKATELKILKRLRHLQSEGKGLVVAGCMASVMAPEVSREFPDALVVAPLEYDGFREAFRQKFGAAEVPRSNIAEGQVTAIVPVAQGCLGSCTYCITKLARGTLDSRPVDQVVSKVRSSVENGAKEVLLTAQDTGCYGLDIGTDLAELIEAVVAVPGDFKVRVGMMGPENLAGMLDRLIGAYRRDKVYKFLHLPVQTGSDRLLRSMGRNYKSKDFEAQVAAFRSKIPKLTLSTDIITGFPGETEEDHMLSLSLIGRVRPNIVNVTRFSARPGTAAEGMKGQVVSRISKDRSREFARLRFEIAADLNRARHGERVMVTATEVGKGGTVICRDAYYTPVVVHAQLPLGSRTEVEITGSRPTHLFGRVVAGQASSIAEE